MMREHDWGLVNPVGPRSCYDEGKRCAEALVAAYVRSNRIRRATIVRPFNVYGPGMDPNDGRILPNFVRNAVMNDDLDVYGSGHATRCYCYVDDFVDALVMIAEQKRYGVGIPLVLNVGSQDELTVNEVAETVLNVVDTASEVRHSGEVEDDPPRRVPSVMTVRDLLGWQASTPFEEGVARMARDYEKRLLGPQGVDA